MTETKKDLIRDPASSRLSAAWLDETNTLAAHEMISYLKATVDTNRPINSLPLPVWKALACTGWSAYIVALSKRPKPQAPDERELELWLG